MAEEVSQGGTSATQRQKFHTDDAEFVRNPVPPRETSLSGDERGERSAVRRLV